MKALVLLLLVGACSSCAVTCKCAPCREDDGNPIKPPPNVQQVHTPAQEPRR